MGQQSEDTIDHALTMLTNALTRRLSRSLARELSKSIREQLQAAEPGLVSSVERWLLTATVRRLIAQISTAIDRILADIVERALSDVSERVVESLKRALKAEIESIIVRFKSQTPRVERAPTVSSEEVERWKRRAEEASAALAKFFNLCLRYIPELHVLPLLEEMGHASISFLASTLSLDKTRLERFLKVLEEEGLVEIRGGEVVLLRPIFRRR